MQRTPSSLEGARARVAMYVAAALVAAASPARAQTPSAGTGSIVGSVVMKEGGFPLGYSTVSAPELGREKFSDQRGSFVLLDLPAGPVRLLVRHLGYTPAEITVTVREGAADTVRVTLTRIAIRLTAVEVRAFGKCLNPGVPTTTDDSVFATLFDQLRQNAEQYRLLAGEYPFQSTVARTFSRILVRGDSDVVGVDTVLIDSRLQWKYQPGTVLTTSHGGSIVGGQMVLKVPNIIHFADSTFLANHCFENRGLERIAGAELLRIDFMASSHIADPDVDGSIYLDPATFQVRQTVLRLSRIPESLPTLKAVEAVTVFAEALPSVPVISSILSVNRVRAAAVRSRSIESHNEEQRLIRIDFLRGRPGEDFRPPIARGKP